MGRPVRVAIVDDDEAFRRALTRLLVTLGFDVWSCSSAEELLASPEDETFRLPRRDSIARRLVDDWIAGRR